MCVIEGLF